jgi:nitrite reductase (NADH) large subunit
MKKIVIIGNSAAGVAAAEVIRQEDKASRISIVSKESFPAYERPKILGLLEGKLKERELYYRPQDFYKNHEIDLILEREVVELNLNKKKAIFKDRDFIEFDELIIATGTKVVLPDLKGIQKEGVVAFNGLKDAKFIFDNTPIAHTVIVVGIGGIAEEVARIIAAKQIEVKFFGTLRAPMDGVDAAADNPIVEILGDSDVKAVRLSNQKVLGASLVIFTGPRQPQCDFLKETEIKINKGILVDTFLRTNVPFVFAVGDVSEFSDTEKLYGWEAAQAEGRRLGGILCQT